jgi:hypothetical protein
VSKRMPTSLDLPQPIDAIASDPVKRCDAFLAFKSGERPSVVVRSGSPGGAWTGRMPGDFRTALLGYPPRAPTDPYVRHSRIPLLLPIEPRLLESFPLLAITVGSLPLGAQYRVDCHVGPPAEVEVDVAEDPLELHATLLE